MSPLRSPTTHGSVQRYPPSHLPRNVLSQNAGGIRRFGGSHTMASGLHTGSNPPIDGSQNPAPDLYPTVHGADSQKQSSCFDRSRCLLSLQECSLPPSTSAKASAHMYDPCYRAIDRSLQPRIIALPYGPQVRKAPPETQIPHELYDGPGSRRVLQRLGCASNGLLTNA